MPAAAVIPAPIAYTKVVAVKKLVVGFLSEMNGRNVSSLHLLIILDFLGINLYGIYLSCRGVSSFTVSKIECSKQA